MVRILVFFIAAIICKTSDSYENFFCIQNFNLSTNYSISFDNYAFNLTHLTIFLFNENAFSNSKIIISSPKGIGLRIKTEQNDNLNSFQNRTIKYDVSSENCIINQSIFKNFNKFSLKIKSERYFQLQGNDITLKIYGHPFIIEIFKSTQKIATINKNNHFLFEYSDSEDIFGNLSSMSGVDISLNDQDTYFYSGLGGISQSFNIDDQIYRLYNSNIYPNYSSIPFIFAHSSSQTQVGLFWANPSETYVQCKNSSIHFLSEAGFVDLYIFLGSIIDIQSQYSILTGKPYFAPIFSLGYHLYQSHCRTQDEVNTVILNLKNALIPFDSIWLGTSHLAYHASFGYNETTFPEPKKLIGSILSDDRYLLRLSNPYLPMNVNNKQFNEAKLNGYLINKSDEFSPFIYRHGMVHSAFPDFLNKNTRKWWSNQYNYNVDISNTNVFYWNDKLGVLFPKDSVHYNSFKNSDIHNIYGLLMSAATSQGLIDRNLQNKEKSSLRPYMVSLNIFAGSQKYTWSWAGDTNSSWPDLRKSLAQIVANSISGIPFTGSDIGGLNGSPSDELIIRWFQLATWTYPFFRQQSSSSSKNKEPYHFTGESFIAISNAITERYRHLLVWYSAAHISSLTGNPIVKPLWAYQESTSNFPQAHTITDQIILADSFMVAPIIEENQTIRHVIKPPGRWYCYPGGFEIQESTKFLVTIMDTPIFLSGGKIILVYEDIGLTAMQTLHKENLELFIALDENSEAYGEVYIDDGVSYGYLNGSFFNAKIKLNNGRLIINHNGHYGSSESYDDSGLFIQKLKIVRIHIFGLKKNPKKNQKYETIFNGDKYLIHIDDFNPLYLNNVTDIKIIDLGLSTMTIATIVIGILLGLTIIIISIIVPLLLLRREKTKKMFQDEENTSDMKNPILNNESI